MMVSFFHKKEKYLIHSGVSQFYVLFDRLLEQPRRLERAKSSPRKSKSASHKSKQTALICKQEQNADMQR